MAMNAEHRSKFAAFHPQWWCLQMSKKYLSGLKKKQTNNIKNKGYVVLWVQMYQTDSCVFVIQR